VTEDQQPSPISGMETAALLVRVGLIAGTLDIADALIFSHFRGATPSQVFHYIASGLIGSRAFQLGASGYALGVAIHYAIALFWTCAFYVCRQKLALLRRAPVVSGLLYGIVVYGIMNFVVLPLSGVPKLAHVSLAGRVNGVLALMLCIGLTVSLLLDRGLRQN